MDFGYDDNFNTPWMLIFSLLGLATAVSGFALWLLRARRRAQPQRRSAGRR